MDPNEAVMEGEVDLNQAALQLDQARRREQLEKKSNGESDTHASSSGSESTSEDADEESPLLSRQETNGGMKPQWEEDHSHLRWYKRPSIFWVLAPFFLMTMAFGGVISPKINLILDLICRQYISERQSLDPGFTMAPVNFGNSDGNDQCRIPEVQSRVSIFMLWCSLTGGLLSAITSPKLGALSDRYGRKPILVFTSFGTIAGEIITIIAATYPETFPVWVLLIAYAIDGLTGSFIVAMAVANSYATDCSPPNRRNVAFGYFHAALFGGIAIGPVLAAEIVKKTGKIVVVFYILLAVHVFFVLFISLAVPESLSKDRQLLAREKSAKKRPAGDWIEWIRQSVNSHGLEILWPKGRGTSARLRWNLFVLAVVDTILFGVAMGSMTVVIIYTNYQFGWRTVESGQFMSIVSSSRVFSLIVILPIATRLIRGKADTSKKNKGSDLFDLSVVRVAVFFDMLGYLGYTLARKDTYFIISGAVAAIGGIGSPTLQSALTKHVPADQTGQLLGAIGLLHALARVVAPTVFHAIYASTVGNFTQAVFVCLTATFGLAFLVSWFIRPGVFFDDDAVADEAEDIEIPAASK